MTSVSSDRRQGLNSGAAVKVPCDAATTANITLSGEQTIDGVACVTGDRVLVKNQTDASENGIYVVDTGTWDRARDWDGSYDIVTGTFMYVTAGSANRGYWYVSTTGTILVGTTNVTISQASTTLAVVSTFFQTLQDDTSAGEVIETLRNDLTAETTVVNDDEVLIRDTSATAGKRITVRNLMKVITELATETAPDAADEVAIYDASAATADKVTLTVLAEALRALATAKRGPGPAENYSLSASVAASALTITLSGYDGTALSSTNKAQFAFRSATAATGTTSTVDATANLTLTISSGSTLGTTSAVPARFWIVLFNDAGTLRLGAINCSTSTAIYPLSDDTLASSTAEGGAGAADSAGVIYTGSAVTAKAMRVLGYVEHTQATAGTYATTPSKVQLWQTGMKLPGDVVQTHLHSTGSVSSSASTMPYDDTIPQNTEGAEYMSLAITPTAAANLLEVSAQFVGSADSATPNIIVALFQDSTANALASVFTESASSSAPNIFQINHLAKAAGVSSTTFKVRAGNSAASTTTFNGAAGARKLGGVCNSFLKISELMG